MKCPHCASLVSPQQNACSACGFTATLLHHYLGNQWVRLERIIDAAHCLRLEDARQIEVVLDNYERSFPQAFFAIYLGVLPNNLTVAELGFWLLNQGAFNTHSVNRRNDYGIILVVDPSTKTASVTLGYSIERCFSTKDVSSILQILGVKLRHGSFGAALEAICKRCSEVLRKHARRVQWQPDSKLGAGVAPDMGLQPLRGGHKPATRTLADHSNSLS